MASAGAVEVAGRMGGRAGESFLEGGIWPRCPFRDDAVADLARAWGSAVIETARLRMLELEAARTSM